MKQILRINLSLLAWICAIEMSLVACSKTASQPAPVSPDTAQTNYKFKIMEYMTNEPIKDVQMQIISHCIQFWGPPCPPDENLASGYSDENGTISVRGSNLLLPRQATFFKQGFWERHDYDEIIHGKTQDSCVLRLFAYGFLAVHLKFQNPIGPALRFELHFEPVYDSLPTGDSPGLWFDHLANGFDSTFVFSTYGNVMNNIELKLENNHNEFPIIYSGNRFVKKNDTLHWEIIY
jgi:hypothetical protein